MLSGGVVFILCVVRKLQIKDGLFLQLELAQLERIIEELVKVRAGQVMRQESVIDIFHLVNPLNDALLQNEGQLVNVLCRCVHWKALVLGESSQEINHC